MATQMYQPQQVVYYDGVPYLTSGNTGGSRLGINSMGVGMNLAGLGMGGLGGIGGLMGNRGLSAEQIQQMIKMGRLSPLEGLGQPKAPPYEFKPAPIPTSPAMQRGWSPSGNAGGMDMNAILNGPQFGNAAAPTQAVPPAVPPAVNEPALRQHAGGMPQAPGGGVVNNSIRTAMSAMKPTFGSIFGG